VHAKNQSLCFIQLVDEGDPPAYGWEVGDVEPDGGGGVRYSYIDPLLSTTN
jgi:hypothetical protein